MNRGVEIKEITLDQARTIVDIRKPFGLFYLLDDDIYIGIDNSTGDAWTEEFANLHQCKKWLRNPSLLAPSQK